MNETIEGKNSVLEALKAGREVNKIFIGENLTKDRVLSTIISIAKKNKIPVQNVGKTKINDLAETNNHQGIIAMVAAKEYASLEEIIQKKPLSESPIILMVDGIEDPHNLGAIIRTCDAVGVAGVVIPNRRNVGLTGIVSKASAGAVEYVSVARVTNLSQTIDALKEAGFWVVGCEASGEKTIYEVDLKMPLVLVVGGEGKGISRLVQEKCDFLTKLPMVGNISSLNASVAASVCLYEALKQRI
ncbi:MAG: RNA methyltransferase [Desulfitibacter sp. BRH_c19]|nr:MAG: RNA methyltransferase [Desulfitibacter sp. BRH_c19]